MSKPTIGQIRRAVAKYIASEGCDCCRGRSHDKDADRLAKLLDIPPYSDGSGYDFNSVLEKRATRRRSGE